MVIKCSKIECIYDLSKIEAFVVLYHVKYPNKRPLNLIFSTISQLEIIFSPIYTDMLNLELCKGCY